MPVTGLRGRQVLDGDITRSDINTSTAGSALIARIIAGTNISITSTGADSGTGDVTISAVGGGTTLNGTGFVRMNGAEVSYITGTAAQFLMANGSVSTNPGWITGYTETDTLATVTGRGATTTAAISVNSVTGSITSSGSGDSNAPFRFGADYSGWMTIVAGTPGSNNGWGLFWAGNSGAQYGTNGTGGPGDIWTNSGNPNEYVFVGNGQTNMAIHGNTGNVWIAGTLRVAGTITGTLSGNASTASALTSMNISQFTNNSGYITSSGSISGSAGSATQVVTLQDNPPSGVNGQLWFETDTLRLKVYSSAASAWIDSFPMPDMSLYYTKAGGAITGSVVIQQDLTVNGQLSADGILKMNTTGTSYIRMGRFPASTTNSGEAWIGRASDRSVGTMTVQLGTASDRVFEVVDNPWSTVIFAAGMSSFSYKGNTIWHAGNDGSGTGLDADLLDGYHQTDFVRLASSSSSPTNGTFAIGTASSRNFIQSHGGQPLDINPLGNTVTIGGTGNTAWHSGNLTNLNQLTNGPGYITSYTETDTLASVTGRGSSTNTAVSFTGGSRIVVQASQDGGNSRGIFMWNGGDSNWGIYMAQAGAGKALSDGTAPAGIDGRTEHAIRFRVAASTTQIGFLWENSDNNSLMQLQPNTGNLYTRGQIYAGNSTSNLVWHSGNLTNLNQLSNGPGYVTGGPYLALSGGTMTGNVQFNANTLQFNNSGVRLWNMAVSGGNLNISSGDGSGSLLYNSRPLRDSFYRTFSGYSDYYSSGSSGWYRAAEITLTGNCSGAVLYGTLYDHRYDGADTYQIAIVARAECDFTSNNESHYINVGCTILGSTNYTNYRDKIRVVLSASSTNSRTYELQFYETNWNHDTWQLETTGWTVYTSPQAPRAAVGTPRVNYISNKSADNIRANTGVYSPHFYDSSNAAYYLDGNVSGGWRLGTPSGTLDFGPLNGSFCHFQTDRAQFYFNKTVYIDGPAYRYGGSRFVEETGTWAISITGNSATTSQRSFSGDISTSGQGRFTGWYSGTAATGAAVEAGWSGGEGYVIAYNRNTSAYGNLNLNAVNIKIDPQGGIATVSGSQIVTNNGGTWGINITGSAGSASSATSATQVVTIQDNPPSGSNGRLWWESDTGKLKVYYGSSSAWVDATPIPDMSLYYPKAGGSINGDVTVQQTLNVIGNVLIQGTLTETSDISLKENILPLENSLDKVMKLNGVSFNKKATPEIKEIGFIAQEVEAVIPDLVTETDEGIKTVSYSRVAAVLVETIKEQQAQIDELKGLVNKLTDKFNNI